MFRQYQCPDAFLARFVVGLPLFITMILTRFPVKAPPADHLLSSMVSLPVPSEKDLR